MKPQFYLDALVIISKHHSNEIIINKVEPNGSVSKVLKSPTIHIKNCVPSVINELIKAGYSVSMNDGLLQVENYN